MTQFLSVREARRSLAEVMNVAAYQGSRTVINRRGEIAGAFVSPEDLIFLLRYRPLPDSGPSAAALDEDRAQIEWRAQQLAALERTYREHGASEEQRERLSADREKLAADRRLLDAMMTLQGKARSARRAADSG